MKLAHFSDLHLLSLKGVRALDFASKRWIGGLHLLTSRARHYQTEVFEAMVTDLNAQDIDHAICTGDVTNLALEHEYEFARTRFDKLTLGSDGVTVIPGNHDAYVAIGVQFFAGYFSDYHDTDDRFAWPDGNPWPVIRVRDGVAVIGLTTSRRTPWFTAYGEIGFEQCERLRIALERTRDYFQVVALHHPPAGRPAQSRIRGLKDRDAFAEIIREYGADLILHGHEHRDIRSELAGPKGSVPVLGIQSGTYAADKPHRLARYRIFTIEDGRFSHELRVWSPDNDCFIPDTAEQQQAA